MRKLLQRLLSRPIANLANQVSSAPDKKRVDKALSDLYAAIQKGDEKLGRMTTLRADDKTVILSDQHKGVRDGADIFALAEKNYLAALDYYFTENYHYINLGDSEELWENRFLTVKKHNGKTFAAEKKFISENRFTKVFGNHDLYWDNDPLAPHSLVKVYGTQIPIYEGVILKTIVNHKPLHIFMTHGHQGDLQSDGNWFSKWFVSNIWGPFQGYLRINPNTPANDNELKSAHNRMMYEWSSKRENLILVTGHTHQPVFKSLTHLEMLYEQLEQANKKGETAAAEQLKTTIAKLKTKPGRMPEFKGYLDTYFNSGCCCFDDGDITGIEVEGGNIRLIKWAYEQGGKSVRHVLAENALKDLKLK